MRTSEQTDKLDEALAAPPPIMEMSADISALAKVLPKAQADMGEVFKTANNPAFRSKYADLAAVVEAVLPALNKHGIALLQPVAFDGTLVHVGTVLLHESGQWVRCTHSIPLSKRDAHGIGSATTYGRRQGLQAMSGVAPVDDDANAAVTREPVREPPKATPKDEPKAAPTLTLAERANRLEAAMRSHVGDAAKVQKAYDLGAGLCAELDDKDPERLAELNDLLVMLLATPEMDPFSGGGEGEKYRGD